MPNPWCFDNFVAFLLQRSRLIPIAVAMRVREGHCEEAGQIVNTLKTVFLYSALGSTISSAHLPLGPQFARATRTSSSVPPSWTQSDSEEEVDDVYCGCSSSTTSRILPGRRSCCTLSRRGTLCSNGLFIHHLRCRRPKRLITSFFINSL